MREHDDMEVDETGEASFEELVVSIRRWLLGLGLLTLVVLKAVAVSRSILLGFLVGFGLCLFSLDHLAWKARAVASRGVDPVKAQATFVGHFMVRWLATVAVILVAAKLGANPIAAVASLLLLQAAIVCRSIGDLLMRSGESDDVDPAGLDPETVE